MATVPDPGSLATSEEIQGNILAPFRNRHQAFLFVCFGNQRAQARQWLSRAVTRVSSTAEVAAAEGNITSHTGSQPYWMNLGVTATGLVTLHPEVADDLMRFEAFWSGPLGMRVDESGYLTTTPALLGDVDGSDPKLWVVGGPERPPVDALLTLAAEDRTVLSQAVSREEGEAKSVGLAVVPLPTGAGPDLPAQYGEVYRNEHGHSIEHFGFSDGMSQPGIRGFTGAVGRRVGSPIIAAGEFVLGHPGERRPPTRAPRPAPAPWMRDGSFQVFRRLCQDVPGWWAKMAALSGWGSAAEEVGAKAIGRRRDGTPLVPNANPQQRNDFTYEADPNGWYTPFYAHIRKMNPRDDERFRDRSHKLLRRGISFGPRYDAGNSDNAERGLLFNAYMASIEDQFEFLQRRWANDPEFPASTLAMFGQQPGEERKVDGLDPVIGDDAEAARRRVGKRIARDIPPLALGGFVTTTGAVYAFAPSRTALAMLAGDESFHAWPGRG